MRGSTRLRVATCGLLALLGLLPAGCGGGSGGAPAGVGGASGPGGAGSTLSGHLLAGSAPIIGATIRVYAAGTAAGEGPTLLAQATTDAQGAFSASVACPGGQPDAQVYVTATGGSTTAGGDNAAVALLAALGSCQNVDTVIDVNALTTVAAAYALSAFIGANGVAGKPTGLATAMATAAALVDPGSGVVSATLPADGACAASPGMLNCETTQKLVSLANALAACSATTAPSSAACANLLACTTVGAALDSVGGCSAPAAAELPAGASAPRNTLEAALSVAQHPGAIAVAGLYAIAAPVSGYGAGLAAAPNDWALPRSFVGGGLSEPTGVALDAAGNVWVANYGGAVTKLSPTGVALSPAAGFTGGGLEESFGIAVDPAGNVWVCNEQSAATVNSGLGSLTELAPDGGVVSGAEGISAGGLDFPIAVLADAAGHVWAVNYGDSTLSEFAAGGAGLSPAAGYGGGGLSFPVGLALDGSGNVWVANQGANQISAFSSLGAAVSPSGGFTGGGLDVPQGIAVDQGGHVWVTNAYGASVAELGDDGAALSGATGDGGGGLNGPGGIAIDGAGTVWVANYYGASISALEGATSAAPGQPLSPPAGFVSASLLQPFALAVDAAGNLWVTNYGNGTVTEFIGIAAAVRTPLTGPPQSP